MTSDAHPYAMPDAGIPAPSNVRGAEFPRIHGDLSVSFRVTAPSANSVEIIPLNDGLGWQSYPMSKREDGNWTVTTPPARPGFHYYELSVDGRRCTDPLSESYFGWGRQTSGLEIPDPNLDFYDVKPVPHGHVEIVSYFSKATGKVRRAYVYTPPGYGSDASKYPVLYLQHGAGESERGWSAQGRANFILDNLIATSEAVPMLIVMDNGYADVGKDNQFEQNLIQDLIPFVDHEFRTIPDPEHRALAGLSMGGGQAITIGPKHLDRFHSVGAFSGAFRGSDSLTGLLADPKEANRRLKVLWFGCGIDDSLIQRSSDAHKALDLAGIRNTFESFSGSHEWQVWRKCLHSFAPLLFRPVSEARTAVDLRCEYLVNPLGIDTVHPRLSWRLQDSDPESHNFHQTGYRLLVASTPELLSQMKADLWDSGEISSDASTQITYGGRPLGSRQSCWWKVEVRDERHRHLPWSRPAHWSVGLLDEKDWSAKWIATGDHFLHPPTSPNYVTHENNLPDPWFRKSFDLSGVPRRATVYIASIGYHELYVNGIKVTDAVLEPAVSDLTHRVRYRTFEVGHLLHPGKNTLAVWLGVSWSIFPHYLSNDRQNRPAMPMALVQAEITGDEGRIETIGSDESWKTHPSPNRLLGVWDFMNYGGEEYDARNEVPGWNLPELDDSSWQPVQVYHPNVVVSSEALEPNRLVHLLEPIKIDSGPDGSYRVDMGRNYSGWLEVALEGKPGNRIEFLLSERDGVAETHKLHSAYVIGPSGRGVFQNRFNYGVGRWVTIKGLATKPRPDQIRGWLVRSSYDEAAEFDCSNPLLNKIYDTTRWTFENLSLGGYVVDCSQRERMGYGGDAHSTTQAALNNYHMGAFYTKWAQDWRDVQGADGNLPYTAPTYWGGGGPVWSSFCIHLPWEVYRWYGDKEILKSQFPTMQRWLGFLETKSKDGMLVRWGGEWDFLGDWLWPKADGVNGDTQETLFLNNAYWVYALKTTSKIASILGDRAAAKQYADRAEAVAKAVHAHFYRPASHDYPSGDQAYLAMALLAGIPPESERPLVWKRLEEEIVVHRNGHIYAGITGGALMNRLLVEQGRPDLMYTMAIKPDYPGWGEFINRGETTIPEDWESRQSLMHSSYLYIGAWFIEGLIGIRQDADVAGYQHVTIRPMIDAKPGLDHAAGSFATPYGKVRCAWSVIDQETVVTVTVPPNSTARLELPVAARHVSPSDGVRFTDDGHGIATTNLVSGAYRFTIHGAR